MRVKEEDRASNMAGEGYGFLKQKEKGEKEIG